MKSSTEQNSADQQPDIAREKDQSVLDAAFEAMLRAIEEGHDADPAPFVVGHEHLSAQLDALCDLAREIGIGPSNYAALPVVDGYTVVSLLGRGGMGSVYLALQKSMGNRAVALKVLAHSLASASSRERFKREAFAIAQLQHPNIIAAFDVVRTGHSYAYTMEFVDGCSLQKLIEGASASMDPLASIRDLLSCRSEPIMEGSYAQIVARWGMAIADALHTMHLGGLIHRDVKPSNILIRRDGTPLLSDFGLVYQVNQETLTMPGAFAGTLPYAAPEQLRGGFHDLSPAADIYSLGATLYHALALRLPFSGASAVQILRAVEAGPPPPLAHANAVKVPADLEIIVRKAMSLEASERYKSALHFANDLERFLSQRPILARKATLAYRFKTLAQRNRRAVAASALACVLSLIAAVAVGTRIVLFPQWSQDALKTARMAPHIPSESDRATLGASPHDFLFSMSFWQWESAIQSGPRSPVQLRRLKLASEQYEKAIFFGDPTQSASSEREAVRAAMNWDLPENQREKCESAIINLYSSKRLSNTTASGLNLVPQSVLNQEEIAQATNQDLRQLGLVAYLTADPHTSKAAWSELENRGTDDPFVAGMLGILHLINESPQLAYPRLQIAMIAFPDAPLYIMFAADAAVQVGDISRARQYLDLATKMKGHDAGAAFRINMMIRASEENIDDLMRDLRAEYCLLGSQSSSVLTYHLCKIVQKLNRPDLVLELATLSATEGFPARRSLSLFRRTVEPWWQQQSESDKLELVRLYLLPDSPRYCMWRERLIFAMYSCDIFPIGSSPDWAPFVARLRIFESKLSKLEMLESPQPMDTDFAAKRVRTLKLLVADRADVIAAWILHGGDIPPELLP